MPHPFSLLLVADVYSEPPVTSIVFGYFKVGRRNNILDVVDVETVRSIDYLLSER